MPDLPQVHLYQTRICLSDHANSKAHKRIQPQGECIIACKIEL